MYISSLLKADKMVYQEKFKEKFDEVIKEIDMMLNQVENYFRKRSNTILISN